MAANTDKFKRLARKWVGSIGAGGVADGTVTTIPLSSSSGLPTDTAVVATIDRVDANGVATPSLEESVVGVVSGDNLVTCTRGVEGTAQAHSAGAVVEILFTNKVWGDLIDGILAEHSQAGAHTTDTISEKTADAGVTVDGLKIKDGEPVVDDAKDIKFSSGAKIERIKGDIQATPEAGGVFRQIFQRVGGNSTDWAEGGTSNYDDQAGTIQCGAAFSNSEGNISVTFNREFSATPIVVITQHSSLAAAVVSKVTGVTSTGFTAQGAASQWFSWIAIGPIT